MITLIPARDYRKVAWKNGGGTATDIAVDMSGEATIHWRIGFATITANGPFSSYPGVIRRFAIIAGAGVVLDFPGHGLRRVELNEIHEFPGHPPPFCELANGSSTAFNLLVEESFGTPDSRIVIDGRVDMPPETVSALHALEGAWTLTHAGGTLSVPQGDTALARGQGWQAAGTGRAIVLSIRQPPGRQA